MTEFYQFALNNIALSSAWILVAVMLLGLQVKLSALGPKSVTSQMLTQLVNREDAVVVDVRGQNDFDKGHIQGAINAPLSKLKENTKDLEKYKDSPIIMVCANGIQVSGACDVLKKAGFAKIHKLSGGMTSWRGDNLPVVK